LTVINLTIFAMLAEQGFATKTRFARCRINGLHPELVTPRLKMLDADMAQVDGRI
jgi:hypothetical protein